MSNKGAIKKVSASRDGSTNHKLKSKSSLLGKEADDSEKVDIRMMRMSQTLEKRRESTQSKSTPSIQSNKSSIKHSVRTTKSNPIKENTQTMAKSNTNNPKMLTSKISTDAIKKLNNNNAVKSSKSSGTRMQSGYSEKRGQSTVYIPQSMTSKLNAKLSSKNVASVSKSEEQIRRRSNDTESKPKSRQRKLSRTLSPSEVKMLHSAINGPDSLQKVDQSKKKQAQEEISDEYDYEDDFEDYESDFQECTDSEESEVSEETNDNQNNLPLDPIELNTAKQRKIVNSIEQKEEEHMHDSGHYELTEARRRAARIESIANDPKLSSLLEIRQPINKSYSEDKSENKSLPLSTDEGFEDSRSGDFTKSPPLSQISFIDFRKTKEEEPKPKKKNLSRGEVLLGMIKLDVMEWSLLECSPIPYEEFIRNYGRLNTQQMSTQTGEDNIDLETQTEKIELENKWTQFPVTCRNNLRTKEDLDLFRLDQIGVGSDYDPKSMKSLPPLSFDILRLNDFMSRAGRVMLSLLEERRSGGNVFKNEEEIPFSDGVVKLSVNSVTFLAGRPVTIIHYSKVLNKILLTIHSPVEEEIETSSKQDYITDCCIGCVWNISEPSMPVKLFYSACPITACCFHLTNYNVVFAGLQDGSISLWDLKEDEMWHHKVTDKANELDWTIRMPTYTTAANIKTDASQIVAIRVISKIEEKSLEQRNNKFVPLQICSLSENGFLNIWSVLHNVGKSVDDLGLSFWGNIRLVKSQELICQSSNRKKSLWKRDLYRNMPVSTSVLHGQLRRWNNSTAFFKH
ncbi:WD repeat-containing protein 60 isoform X2 [Ceratina calcarata]|uniref:WD repeat-containing protein 60 isoform X2 n=1 Tax=Ceratina calcarata TaxID=156304 RepID=A0AAJ7IVS5_9HYME|nr:WD repeat-containing protein 60 isoform X2 [Ceratina calcarata]